MKLWRCVSTRIIYVAAVDWRDAQMIAERYEGEEEPEHIDVYETTAREVEADKWLDARPPGLAAGDERTCWVLLGLGGESDR